MTSAFILIILIYVEHIVSIMAAWTIASEKFPREHSEMSVGVYDGIIYLVGDWGWPDQVSKYNPISDTLTTSYGVLSTQLTGGYGAQHWTQQGSILYILQHGYNTADASPLSVYDMAAETLTTNWRGITTSASEYVGDSACLSSTPQNIYVVGGGDGMMRRKPSSSLQILSLLIYEWDSNPNPPSMIQERGGISCIIANEYLWVFGGFATSIVHDTNERIPIINIAQNVWQYVESLSIALSDTRAVLWGDDIYILGGKTSTDGLGGEVDVVHIMDTKSATMLLSPDTMSFRNAGTAPVIVDSVLYAFGGMHVADDTYLTNEWTFYNLPAISSSSDPSIFPSNLPTHLPSNIPSHFPSDIPTHLPSINPSHFPSDLPTHLPSINPSVYPSVAPSDASIAPSDASRAPSSNPSIIPSHLVTINPSQHPSNRPTDPSLRAIVPTTSSHLANNTNNAHNASIARCNTNISMEDNQDIEDNDNGGHLTKMLEQLAWIGLFVVVVILLVVTALFSFKKWKAINLVKIEKKVVNQIEKDVNVNANIIIQNAEDELPITVEGNMQNNKEKATIEGEADNDSDHKNDDLWNAQKNAKQQVTTATTKTVGADDEGSESNSDLWKTSAPTTTTTTTRGRDTANITTTTRTTKGPQYGTRTRNGEQNQEKMKRTTAGDNMDHKLKKLCKDCGLMKLGATYKDTGCFYCTDCWNYYY